MGLEAREFRESQKCSINNHNIENKKLKNDNKNHIKRTQKKYTTKKGTADALKKKTNGKLKKIRLKLASLILAAGIGMTGISYVVSQDKSPELTITQLQDMGIDESKIGLNEETIEKMIKYDEYFSEFDEKKLNITDNDVIVIAEDIDKLIFDVIKEKVAKTTNVTTDDIKLQKNCTDDEAPYQIIRIDRGDYIEVFKSKMFSEKTMPNEVENLITEIYESKDIIQDIKKDKISKVNAIKKLEKIYKKISEVATNRLYIDKDGDLALESYSKTIEKNNNTNLALESDSKKIENDLER